MAETGFSFYFFIESIKTHINTFPVSSWISFLFRDKRLRQNQLKKQINKQWPIWSLLPQENRLWPISQFFSKRTTTEHQWYLKLGERHFKEKIIVLGNAFSLFLFGFILVVFCLVRGYFFFSCGNVLFNSPIIIYPLKNISIEYKVIQMHFSSAVYAFSFILLHLFRALEDSSWSREVL